MTENESERSSIHVLGATEREEGYKRNWRSYKRNHRNKFPLAEGAMDIQT